MIFFLLLFLINNALGCNCTLSEEYKEWGEGLFFISGFSFLLAGYSLFFSWQNYNSIKSLKYNLIQ